MALSRLLMLTYGLKNDVRHFNSQMILDHFASQICHFVYNPNINVLCILSEECINNACIINHPKVELFRRLTLLKDLIDLEY